MALVDVRRAYFYASARRRAFVELPPEDYQPGDEHTRGLLQYSLYGTRDTAQNWEKERTSTLSDFKLTRGSHAHACGEDASRRRTLLRPCTETTSQSVEDGRRWNPSSK